MDNYQVVGKVNKLEQKMETRKNVNKTLNLQLQSLKHESLIGLFMSMKHHTSSCSC